MTPDQMRFFDIFILGPFMLWFGSASKDVPAWARYAMIFFGGTTILYNARRLGQP